MLMSLGNGTLSGPWSQGQAECDLWGHVSTAQQDCISSNIIGSFSGTMCPGVHEFWELQWLMVDYKCVKLGFLLCVHIMLELY